MLTAEQVAELRPVAELFRWARRCGWTRSDSGIWQNAFDREDATVKVGFDTVCVDVMRKDCDRWPRWSTPYPVDSFRQGINILAALDIVPARFFVPEAVSA